MYRKSFPRSSSPADLTIFCCNICEGLCEDPVMTFCGHIFCWPCLYVSTWQHSFPFGCIQLCPVCKHDVGDGIIPIYSCGKSFDPQFFAEKFAGIQIPCRPSPPPLTRGSDALFQGPALYCGTRNAHRSLRTVRDGSARNEIVNPGHSDIVILYRLLSPSCRCSLLMLGMPSVYKEDT
ncbi:hypothetical protein KP509_18G045100 [Ceratopteris richardii]|uniref:RING-type E3 ubiquitin transferase n=1 Tax=Ceratopteris richardii TaxID=49495 RepID=A0A8T2SR97_CERRI|nr:hypothetical protein KP509_18G045100 [Ceratopteris richardii]